MEKDTKAQASTYAMQNRTALSASTHAEAMRENARPGAFTPPAPAKSASDLRRSYAQESAGLGSMPAPPTWKGTAKTAVSAATGGHPMALLDKLGERLAFERSGTRLYDALLDKHDTMGGFEDGPTREELSRFREEELRHFHLLAKAIEELDADPTAMTPSADLVAVESMGIGQVIGDPRTTLEEGLHALLVAELADGEGWRLLIDLADQAGRSEMAAEFRRAEQEEIEHLTAVRRWVAASASRPAA